MVYKNVGMAHMQAYLPKKEFFKGKKFQIVMTPNTSPEREKFDDEHFLGFIHHPRRFPIEYRRISFWEKTVPVFEEASDIGLTITSVKYMKPGTCIEIAIPIRRELQKFRCRVVLVREVSEGYELGLWLLNKSDAARIRIVEQICHIELYLNDKRYMDGPFLSRERVANEWITRFAANFPTI